jgi:hypothetical protein
MRFSLPTTRVRWFVSLIALSVLLSSPGCADEPEVAYVLDGGSYATEQVEELLDDADYSPASDIPYEDAAEQRRDVLVSIRERSEGSEVADLLTTGFPESTPAVPVRVERGEVQGKDAWLIWEAWGEEGGRLDNRRLWVFDAETGMVMHAVSGG